MKMLVISGAQLNGTAKHRGWGGSQNIDYIMRAFKNNGVDEINYVEMRYPAFEQFNAMKRDQCVWEKDWGIVHAPERKHDEWSKEALERQQYLFFEMLEYVLLDAEYDFILCVEHNLIVEYMNIVKRLTDKPVFLYEFDALPDTVISTKINTFKLMDKIFCVEGSLEVLLESVGIEPDTAVTINNGFDPKVFHPIEGIEKNILANFIGNFAKQRQRELEYLFFEPSNVFKNHKFLLRGADKQESEDYPTENYPNIVRDGYAMHKEICNIHNASTLAVASHFGMWLPFPGVTGQKVFEIMGSGTPCLSHNSIGMQSVIDNYKTGFLVNDLKESIEVYQYCIDNPNEAKRIGRSAYKRAVEEFTWDKRAEEMMKHIRGVLK